MPEAEPVITAEVVEQLAKLAELELDAERRTLIRPQVEMLLTDANRVNRFMDVRRDIGPIVRVHQPEAAQD